MHHRLHPRSCPASSHRDACAAAHSRKDGQDACRLKRSSRSSSCFPHQRLADSSAHGAGVCLAIACQLVSWLADVHSPNRFTLTISSNTKGCKNPDSDANAEKEGYLDVLPGFCRDKRALTAFVWLAFFAWLVSLVSYLVGSIEIVI